MGRLSLLWMSDSPTFCTGFATVTREVLRRLVATGRYDVASVGWGYDGWPYDRGLIPYDVYPSATSNLGYDSLARVLRERRPDILVTLGDVWMVEWVAGLAERQHCRYPPYVPIDGGPLYSPWKGFFADADLPVTCSRFGQSLLQEAVPGLDVAMIYHGVDTGVFRPLDAPRPPALEGKFVVGCTARNQPRKNLPLLIRAFAEFCRDKDDVVLYLHSDPTDVGWDLLELLRRYGVFERTCISKSASVTNGLSTARLNEIYNLFDVMVLPTGGEGFGLPIVEAMAAGVPVVATDYSACVELVGGRGELVAVKDFFTSGRFGVDYALPDLDDLVAKLQLLYGDPARRQRHRAGGLAFARTLEWDVIVTEWEELFCRGL
jgi:glycosyltransferase involved in cell wall biosynthesis